MRESRWDFCGQEHGSRANKERLLKGIQGSLSLSLQGMAHIWICPPPSLSLEGIWLHTSHAAVWGCVIYLEWILMLTVILLGAPKRECALLLFLPLAISNNKIMPPVFLWKDLINTSSTLNFMGVTWRWTSSPLALVVNQAYVHKFHRTSAKRNLS